VSFIFFIHIFTYIYNFSDDVLTVDLNRPDHRNNTIEESRDQELRKEEKDRKSISFDCVSTIISWNCGEI
jgi:hypothetical protein